MRTLGLADPAFLGGMGPSGPTDPYFANVSLLLHVDGANGSTTIIDSSPNPKTVTAFGNAQISTAQSRFGGSSIAFDGAGDYLLASNFDGIGTVFTCEFFCRPVSYASFSSYVLFGTINAANSFVIAVNLTGNVLFRLGSATSYMSSSTISIDEWSHIAFSRDASNACRLFVNGSLVASAVISNTLSVSNFFIGGTFSANAYIDELRITQGIARYQNSFTPPTAPFPDA